MTPLLASRRFLPLFATQFLGACNDNLLKNALVMLVTYRIAGSGGAQLLVTLAAGLFILPFFLFSATAGQLADKIDRARLARFVKLAEICLMVIAGAGFALSSVPLLLFALFGMGVHSTFFGPIKYALLPQHLRDDELLAGNGYIEAGTFLAILLGTIIGGLLVLKAGGRAWVSSVMIALALSGYAASRAIPSAPPPEPQLALDWNLARQTWRIVGFSRDDRSVFACILGISWFWLVGATYLSQFAPFVKDTLHAAPEVVTLFLTIFSVGIGIGSFLCNKLLGGEMESSYVPPAAFGMAVFGIDLYLASGAARAGASLTGWREFTSALPGLRVMFDLVMIAICGGIYIVPLYAIMQHRSAARHRARIIAANNVVNALFMAAAALLTLAMLSLKCTIPEVFLVVACGNVAAALACRRYVT
ncbi:MAG: MFS transporter [Pseudomonadota bacterium]|nr:MFS transporter [Pseudomonadota bacterium]MDE3037711.1 MFS transporter [Pseudomonadota bacterium]